MEVSDVRQRGALRCSDAFALPLPPVVVPGSIGPLADMSASANRTVPSVRRLVKLLVRLVSSLSRLGPVSVPPATLRLAGRRGIQDGDVPQVPVQAVRVEPVANDEVIVDLEPDVVDRHRHFPP